MCGFHDREMKGGSFQTCPSESCYREECWGWASLGDSSSVFFFLFSKSTCIYCACANHCWAELGAAAVQPHVCANMHLRRAACWALCAGVTHTNGRGQSADSSLFSSLCLPCTMHMRPLCARGSICMDKAGWSTCLHCWTEMRGVVSKSQKKRKKALLSQFLIVLLLLLWWWWLLMSVSKFF